MNLPGHVSPPSDQENRMPGNPLISVVVCTLNRAPILRVALGSLAAQTLDPDLFEVIVVDNGSTDETREVAESFPANFRYVRETEPGLSHARNRGCREALGDYVAYTDDDCRLPPGWLEAARKAIEDLSPSVFGGPYFAFYNGPKPEWFRDSYGSHDQGRERRVLGPQEYLDGGNLFFLRSLLTEIGGFDPRLGMVGGRLAYGEETALQRHLRATRPGEAIWYVPEVFVHHLVRSDKMDLWRVACSRFALGRDVSRVWKDAPPPAHAIMWEASFTLAGLVGEVFRALFFRNRTEHPRLENHLYERAFPRVSALGGLWAKCRQLAGFPH